MEIDWNQIWQSFVNGCVDLAGRLIKALVILIVGILVIQFVTRVVFRENSKKPSLKKKMDPTVKNFLRSVIKAVLWIIVIVAIVCALGVEIASIITVIAAAGAAIALALQGSLSNVASGFLLIILHPFVLNDFVTIAGQDGTVIDVGICSTTLRTVDNKHVIIPNNLVIGGAVVNYSREEKRRVDLNFSIAYTTDPNQALKVVEQVIHKHELIILDDEKYAPFVRLTEMGESSVTVTAKVWVKSSDYWGVKFDLTEQVFAAFKENQIEIPFPQLDVHVKQ